MKGDEEEEKKKVLKKTFFDKITQPDTTTRSSAPR